MEDKLAKLDAFVDVLNNQVESPHMLGHFFRQSGGYVGPVHIGANVFVGMTETIDAQTLIQRVIKAHEEIIELCNAAIAKLRQ